MCLQICSNVFLLTSNICREIIKDLANTVSAFNGVATPQTQAHKILFRLA